MPGRPVPRRHWRCYGDLPLPTGAEALDEPLHAFPSWFLRIVCTRCGKERMISETHMPQGDLLIRDILDRMRHDGCGGRVAMAELLTGIEGSSRPIRRIVLVEGWLLDQLGEVLAAEPVFAVNLDGRSAALWYELVLVDSSERDPSPQYRIGQLH